MIDLFTTDNPDELSYASNLQAQWDADQETIMRQGRIPAHLELDSVLQKDEYRLLDLIETNAGYTMRDPVTVHYGKDASGLIPVEIIRHVDSLTHDAGFDSPGNMRACLNRCLGEGWIARVTDAINGRERYVLTERGRYAKDLCETDMYWAEMED